MSLKKSIGVVALVVGAGVAAFHSAHAQQSYSTTTTPADCERHCFIIDIMVGVENNEPYCNRFDPDIGRLVWAQGAKDGDTPSQHGSSSCCEVEHLAQCATTCWEAPGAKIPAEGTVINGAVLWVSYGHCYDCE